MSQAPISLPTVRAKQLRAIAEYRGVPIGDLLDAWVRKEWRAIGGTPSLPGLDLAADRDDETGEPQVHFTPQLAQHIIMTSEHARDIARGLEDIMNGVATRFAVPITCAGYRQEVIGERKGRGYILKLAPDLDRDAKVATISGLNASVARDLADAFEFYAIKADALPAQPINH